LYRASSAAPINATSDTAMLIALSTVWPVVRANICMRVGRAHGPTV
jgi:hypothetical protein